ncbi:hypothetical protein T4D_9427 [Trichinella pseudospiralis]|uniref:Uncharacterized protein n=1 Tax=Trichinella pseudospiralis TaxID=6337 RepID=A0A0V1FM00_TRIPS|nr:hypothetical protein T4D_9427 [Trichinella pseudospiralis]
MKWIEREKEEQRQVKIKQVVLKKGANEKKHTHTLSRLSPLTTGTIVSTPVSSNEDDDWSMTKEYFDWSTIRQRRHSFTARQSAEMFQSKPFLETNFIWLILI